MPIPVITSLVASARMRMIVVMGDVRCAVEHRSVNTSLSRKLFFSVCWCIRDAVHLDSRMHAANEAISHIGGQHGQESEEGEEGEEGEERSEEDCEEDPQGRQEEVTRAFERMPAG
jgi:hypothetical protein